MALCLILVGAVRAQDETGVEPITCWWATDKTTVIVGEHLTLTLTCGVIEASRAKVVADLNQLEPTAISLAPFDVVSSTRHQDIQSPPWRYAQYTYTLRFVGESAFGKDVEIPPLKVTYRVHSTIGGGNEGRDQTYLLPALPVRITSLVPKKAGDIRDGSHDTFGDIESRRFRATVELVAAATFFGFALVTLGLAGVRVWGRSRARTGMASRPLAVPAVLAGCLGALRGLRSDVARDGWNPDLVVRALTMFRIAAAVLSGHRVAQTVVDTNVPAREGQIALRRGLLRPQHALLSAPTTPKSMATRHAGGGEANLRRFGEIQHALEVFSAARYSRDGQLDTTALDNVLDAGTRAVRRLRVARLWPARTATRLARSTAALKGAAWSR